MCDSAQVFQHKNSNYYINDSAHRDFQALHQKIDRFLLHMSERSRSNAHKNQSDIVRDAYRCNVQMHSADKIRIYSFLTYRVNKLAMMKT